MEIYERVAKHIRIQLPEVREIRLNGKPTAYCPVDLRCEFDNMIVYVSREKVGGRNIWYIYYPKDPEEKLRMNFRRVSATTSEKSMLCCLEDIVRGGGLYDCI